MTKHLTITVETDYFLGYFQTWHLRNCICFCHWLQILLLSWAPSTELVSITKTVFRKIQLDRICHRSLEIQRYNDTLITLWRVTSEAHCCNVPIMGTTTSPWTDFSRRARRRTHPAFLISSLFFLDWEMDQSALAPAWATWTSCLSSGERSFFGVIRAWLFTSRRSTWHVSRWFSTSVWHGFLLLIMEMWIFHAESSGHCNIQILYKLSVFYLNCTLLQGKNKVRAKCYLVNNILSQTVKAKE